MFRGHCWYPNRKCGNNSLSRNWNLSGNLYTFLPWNVLEIFFMIVKLLWGFLRTCIAWKKIDILCSRWNFTCSKGSFLGTIISHVELHMHWCMHLAWVIDTGDPYEYVCYRTSCFVFNKVDIGVLYITRWKWCSTSWIVSKFPFSCSIYIHSASIFTAKGRHDSVMHVNCKHGKYESVTNCQH